MTQGLHLYPTLTDIDGKDHEYRVIILVNTGRTVEGNARTPKHGSRKSTAQWAGGSDVVFAFPGAVEDPQLQPAKAQQSLLLQPVPPLRSRRLPAIPPPPPDFMPRPLGTQQRVPKQKCISCRRQPSAKGRQPAPAFRDGYCGVNLRYHSDDESSTASNRLQASEGDIPSASALTKEPAIACPQPSTDAQSTGGRGQLGAGSRMGHSAQVF